MSARFKPPDPTARFPLRDLVRFGPDGERFWQQVRRAQAAFLDRYLPFLATTRILIAAVRAGVGRETAHEVIKEHAVAVALAMRERGSEPDLLDRLAGDPRLPLDRAALDAALADKAAFTGAAGDQVDAVVSAVEELVRRYPEAAKYTPGAIL